MSLHQETDQVTYSFLFIITPLEILSTKSNKNLKKSLLLKLGNITQKTTQLNKPIQIPVQVLYSRTLKKYCPLKGIIKVYDINSDGSEVISSVGGFQTEEILNQQKNDVVIQRDIGTSKVKMQIQIQNLGIINARIPNNEKQTQSKAQQLKSVSSRARIRQKNTPENGSSSFSNYIQTILSSQKDQQVHKLNIEDPNKKEKVSHNFKRTVPINEVHQSESSRSIRFSHKKDNQSNAADSLRAENLPLPLHFLDNKQHETASQEQKLNTNRKSVEARGISSQSQTPNKNLQQSIEQLKIKIEMYQKVRENTLHHFKNISECLEAKNGKIWTQFNQKLRSMNWKYKNKHFQKVFNDFFEFMESELSKPKQHASRNKENLASTQSASQSKEKTTQKIKMLNQELTLRTSENLSLRSIQRQKSSLQIKLKSKQRQCIELQNRIKQMQSFKKTLKQENSYLRQQDETMQQIISDKQNQIEILKQQITEIELQYKQMASTIKNDGCEIEELRQEVSNLNEIIDTYRLKYGDLKNTKNRALENQLKECLIWIDQQTRQLEMSDFEDQTQPSHSHNVSEIIKNIQIEGASREEMNSIKTELAGLIKRIDNFLAK